MSYAASITARLGLDRAPFNAGLRDASNSLSRFAQGASSIFGVTFSVGAFAGLARSAVEYGERISDLSKRYSVNAEMLQKVGNAAELNGSSIEGVASGFNKLEIAQSKALGGSEQMLGHFRKLGISIDDLRTLTPEQLMLKLGKSSMNAADAVAVLGKQGRALIPTLQGIADSSVKMGPALDSDSLKALKEAADLFKKLKQAAINEAYTMFAQDVKDVTAVANGITRSFHYIKGGLSVANTAINEVGYAWRKAWDPRHPIDSIKQAAQGIRDIGKLADNPFPSKKPNDQPDVAEVKLDPRTESSLAQLAKDGPQGAKGATEQGWHGWQGGSMTGGTIQAWWAGEQARQVEKIEAGARDKAVRFQDFEGATRDFARADEIRKNIVGLKESDKNPAAALKDAFKTTEDLLTDISDKVTFKSGG